MTKKSKTIKLDLDSGKEATISGATSLTGTQHFKISYDGAAAYIPRTEFVENGGIRTMLMQNGVIITSASDWRAIIEGIEKIRSFPKLPLIEEPGWTREYFCNANGKVFSPKGARRGKALFESAHPIATSKGTLKDWRQQVALPLTGQTILMFVVMAALAAPLLRFSRETHNAGFEFSGPPATGKTTALRLMASVAGSPNAIPTFNSTLAGFEAMFKEHQDMPFPVDEANLADGTKKHLQNFAFRMANGTAKVTAYKNDRAQSRFIFATTANRPFHEALQDAGDDIAGAALERLLPIRIPKSDIGVFDFVPKRFASSGDFAGYLEDAIHECHGTPMGAFLRKLVDMRAKQGEGEIREKLERSIQQFAQRAGVATSSRGKTRATTAFGLVFAAGQMARNWGILPKKWKCGPACMAAYRNYQQQMPDQTPILARLVTITESEGTIDLRERARDDLTDEQIEDAGAFLIIGKGGAVELLLRDQTFDQFFPDYRRIQDDPEFKKLNQRDGEHRTRQRCIRKGYTKERFFCFRLPQEVVRLLP